LQGVLVDQGLLWLEAFGARSDVRFHCQIDLKREIVFKVSP
jgi:hypothetical protein